jgi:tetratricopeptide (TPR) repeat protein
MAGASSVPPPPQSHPRAIARPPVSGSGSSTSPEERATIRKLMLRGRHEDALEMIERADQQGDAELALYAAWIAHEADDDDPDDRHRELTSLAAQALRADRHLGFAYYVLGRVADAQGRPEDASRAFRKAAQLNPEHRDARRCDQALRRRVRR